MSPLRRRRVPPHKLEQPRPSTAYPVLWRFAGERQQMYLRRTKGEPAPWTSDPILAEYRFTNAFRAADRVSQYLIRMAYADSGTTDATLFLRTILFKIFNRIDTWEAVTGKLGEPVAENFDAVAWKVALTARRRGHAIYSGAYIMPSGGSGGMPKHVMHLDLVARMLNEEVPAQLATTPSLAEAYGLLRKWPTLGTFLAFQYAIDLNYTRLTGHAESEFVVPGPGALDGLSKCFESLGDFSPAETIAWMTERQDQEFERAEIPFDGLFGRSLQPIDVQNLLCEVSKYTRASHPRAQGDGRSDADKTAVQSSRTGAAAVLPAEMEPERPDRRGIQGGRHRNRERGTGTDRPALVRAGPTGSTRGMTERSELQGRNRRANRRAAAGDGAGSAGAASTPAPCTREENRNAREGLHRR